MEDISRICNLVIQDDSLSYDEVMVLYIRYLGLIRKRLSDVPNFKGDYDYYVNDGKTNCYAYALRLVMPNFFFKAFMRCEWIILFCPGFFSGIRDINTESKLIYALYSDLDVLGISYSDNIDKNYMGKIALFQEYPFYEVDDPDFHLCRLNDDGVWSSKYGFTRMIERSNEPKALVNYGLIKVLDINKR